MRLVALVTVCGVIAAPLFGCAQVTGIEDISSSTAAQHCVDTVNQLRAGAMLPAITRWTDEEQCADQLALTYASATGTFSPPDCAANSHYNLNSEFPIEGADAFFQSLVNGEWNGTGNHGYLGETTLRQLACGYGTSGNQEAAALLYTP